MIGKSKKKSAVLVLIPGSETAATVTGAHRNTCRCNVFKVIQKNKALHESM